MTNPYAPPRAVVQDVIDHSATVPAGRGERLGAAILDALILGVMVYGPLVVGGVIGGATSRAATDADGREAFALGALALALIGFAVWAWLTIKFVLANGQSIGKKIVGIKVARSDGSDASLGRIFWLRNVVNGLLGIIPLYGLIDVLFIFSESRQCLHDKIADTIVVDA
jgi:uncharacterized RDD family membrane protein YckC